MKSKWIAVCCVFLLAACAAPANIPATSIAPTPTLVPTFAPSPTLTFTPEPTITSTPPEPIILTGDKDTVVDFQKWDGPAILKIKYESKGDFVVQNVDLTDPLSPGYKTLVETTTGAYEGTVPLDFGTFKTSRRFKVTASATWEIRILPIEQARTETIPGTFTGTGDDVVFIKGGIPDALTVDVPQESVYIRVEVVYTDRLSEQLVGEFAPYMGTKSLGPSAIALFITCPGPWSLDITTK